MTPVTPVPWTYELLDELLDEQLQGKCFRSRKRENNTSLIRNDPDQYIAVRLHNTEIVRWYKDGSIVLNSGGWNTVTTRARIRTYILPDYTIKYTDKVTGAWMVESRRRPEEKARFFDGMDLSRWGELVTKEQELSAQEKQDRIAQTERKVQNVLLSLRQQPSS